MGRVIKMLFKAFSDLHPKGIIEKLDQLMLPNAPENIDAVGVYTGGAEEKFLKTLSAGTIKPPLAILAHNSQNSLPAAAEIMSYTKMKGIPARLFLLPDDASKLKEADKMAGILKSLEGSRIGILDSPSPWLISASLLDEKTIKAKFGLELVKIPWKPFLRAYNQEPSEEIRRHFLQAISGAETVTVADEEINRQIRLYSALKTVYEENDLIGLTVKCFHLIELLGTVPCLAFGVLNSEGYTLGCEGDIPALIGLILARKLSGKPGFMANLNWFPEPDKVLMSHCTAPISLMEGYYIPTHFESGLGAAVKGYYPKGAEITIIKVLPDGSLWFSSGKIVDTPKLPNICRTQVVIQMSPEAISQLREGTLGNHSIIAMGNHSAALENIGWLRKGEE